MMRTLGRGVFLLIFGAAVIGAIAVIFVEPPAPTRAIETEAQLPAAEEDAR